MYLHIGYNKVVDIEKIIGIFNSDSLLKSEHKSFIYESAKEDLEKYKSVILFENEKTEFSKIGAGNLLKRYRKEFKE